MQTQTKVEIDSSNTLRKDLDGPRNNDPEPDTYRYVEQTTCAGTFRFKINNRTGEVSEE